jgi:hypothetical protein
LANKNSEKTPLNSICVPWKSFQNPEVSDNCPSVQFEDYSTQCKLNSTTSCLLRGEAHSRMVRLLKKHIIESLMHRLNDEMQRNRPDPNLNFHFLRTYQVLADVSLVSTMLGRRRQFHDPKADSSAIGLSLINLLSDLAIEPRMKASVNKDRIYALLGMANDTELLGIHPDYSESTSCE